MKLFESMKAKIAAGVAVLVGLTGLTMVMFMGGASAAATSCSAADFTTGGVFDLQGYLACQAALADGGGLPATGSNTMQIVGIALGLIAIGVAATVIALRERRRAA
ncbi:MAG: LPXTG cell wall anchor domain-containing protein [Ilumatobacteraceae bacterium]